MRVNWRKVHTTGGRANQLGTDEARETGVLPASGTDRPSWAGVRPQRAGGGDGQESKRGDIMLELGTFIVPGALQSTFSPATIQKIAQPDRRRYSSV